jgi:glycogen synthase
LANITSAIGKQILAESRTECQNELPFPPKSRILLRRFLAEQPGQQEAPRVIAINVSEARPRDGMRMKILIYAHDFFPTVGGVQTYVFELACGLSEWGGDDSDRDLMEVTVVTRTRLQTAEDHSWPFRLVRCPHFRQFIGLVRRADVVHIAGPALLPMMMGLIFQKPVVVEHHGYQSICPNGLLFLGTDRTVCPGHFMASRYWDCVRCNSEEMGRLKSLRALLLEFPRRWLCKLVSSNVAITSHVAHRIMLPRTQTIFYGIRDPGPVPLDRNGNVVQIGYVGRLVVEKGSPILLEAARRLKDDGFSFHLTFVGGGPLRERLESESRALGLTNDVTFTGDLAGADLERAVRPLHIVVMPSMCEETAGLAAIEQMMRGRVVIASDIGGLSEVVGEAGFKFTPGDSEALCACFRKVLKDPSLVASLGSLARDRAVKLFSRDDMIRAHVSLYRETAVRQ